MRLIDADALEALEQLEYIYQPERNGDAYYRAEDVWACIATAPTIEAKPVRHGRWIDLAADELFLYACSECGTGSDVKRGRCRGCFAKMDEPPPRKVQVKIRKVVI